MVDRCQVLATVRVLDLGGPDTDGVGRWLADLGADVLKVEPAGGSPDRAALPTVGGHGIRFAVDNANKRGVTLDPVRDDDRARFEELVSTADVVIESRRGIDLATFGTTGAELADRHRHLVVLSVSDFGAAGPRAHWTATDAVLYAMSTALSRSGPTSGRPVLPPIGIATATANAQAAWAVLAAYFRRLRCGTGDVIDFSRFEAVLQALDPPFGSEGQAAVGQKASHQLWRGRPRNQQIYPTFACRDGHVRVCLLSPRQWRGMWAWLGEPERCDDPKFDTIAARYAASTELNAAMAELFAPETMDDIVAEGQRRGVPVAAVLAPADALASEHFRETGALTTVALDPSSVVEVPTGPLVLEGDHAGLATPYTDPGTDPPSWRPRAGAAAAAAMPAAERPFEGMRIIDLGVIVAGGELGRLFADLGADVIKVESAAYPDGLRQTAPGQQMSRSWALTHRNERSLGLDLRHPDGADLFGKLLSGADALFANFKPGTLAGLGFSHDRLRELNPRLVLAESSAFGDGGPWRGRMGYGPLVRATTGVSGLWSSRDPSVPGFFDATTIFPDHVSARITAVGALASMIAAADTGSGARVHVSQAEVAVQQLAVHYVAEAARSAGLQVVFDDAWHGVYPCAGDDEWCVISLTCDAERASLAEAMGIERLPADDLDALLGEWTSRHDKHVVAERLQSVGVPAAPMNRAVDVLEDPQLGFRRVFAQLTHPSFDHPMPTERRIAPTRHLPDAELRPAPMPGEHTRDICREALGLADSHVDRLLADGIVFESGSLRIAERSSR